MIEIIPATSTDGAELQRISIATFSEAFSHNNDAESMRKYMERSFSIEKLTAELKNPESLFFFARYEGEVVGYLKVNFGQSQSDLKDNRAMEIERIYVAQLFHGKKVGQVLYEKAIAIARQNQMDYVWLGVWEENPRAISFYKKNGFVEFGQHIFRLGDEAQIDILMKLSLSRR